MKALALRPNERYSGVAQLQQDITAYQNGFATAAELPGLWTLIRLWVRRHKTAFGAALVVTMLLLAAAILVVAMWVELRGTAPVFYEKAQALVSQQKFNEAVAPLDYALQRAPKKAEYWLLKGHIHQSLLRLDAAKTAYRQALDFKFKRIAGHASKRACLGELSQNCEFRAVARHAFNWTQPDELSQDSESGAVTRNAFDLSALGGNIGHRFNPTPGQKDHLS